MIFDDNAINKFFDQLNNTVFSDSCFKFLKTDDGFCRLGKGGSSYIYEMYDENNPANHYAAKIIGLVEKIIDPDLVYKSFISQYQLCNECENIVRVLELIQTQLIFDKSGNIINFTDINEENTDSTLNLKLQIIIMEKLDSVILKEKHKKVNVVFEDLKNEEGIISFANQIGAALISIHKNHYLHRDIKLENIFWDEKIEQYKLGDFGAAKYTYSGNAETIIYTSGYGAPEIEIKSQDDYNLTADIYSFGVTLYLLFNELRFPCSNSYTASFAQYDDNFIFPAPVNASEGMSSIIRKMCSYIPEDRYQSVEAVLKDINNLSKNELRESIQIMGIGETDAFDGGETEFAYEDDFQDEPVFDNSGAKENYVWKGKTYEERMEMLVAVKLYYKSLRVVKIILASIFAAAFYNGFVLNLSYNLIMIITAVLIAFAVLSLVPSVIISVCAGFISGFLLDFMSIEFDYIDDLNLWWIFVVGFIAAMQSVIYTRKDFDNAHFLPKDYDKNTLKIFDSWSRALPNIGKVFLLVGLASFFVSYFFDLNFAQKTTDFHLAKLGLSFIILNKIYQYKYLYLGENK